MMILKKINRFLVVLVLSLAFQFSIKAWAAYDPRNPSSTAPKWLSIKTAPVSPASPQAISSSTPGVYAARIYMHENNTGRIYCGELATTNVTDSAPLFKKETKLFSIDDPAKIYCVADSSGQKFHVELLYP